MYVCKHFIFTSKQHRKLKSPFKEIAEEAMEVMTMKKEVEEMNKELNIVTPATKKEEEVISKV